MSLQVVWFKRDLRLADHLPLLEASQRGPLLCLYVLEDEYWQLAETSNRQWLFVRDSLIDLQQQLTAYGGHLVIIRGSVLEALDCLQQSFGTFTLYSHQETGNLWTYQRDVQVASWCKAQQVRWRQSAQNAVRRGKTSTKRLTRRSANLTPTNPTPNPILNNSAEAWHQHWQHFSQQSPLPEPAQLQFADVTILPWQEAPAAGAGFSILTSCTLPVQVCDDEFTCPGRQPGGRQAGLALLQSFLTQRSQYYQSSISSPLTAESGCSRLSAHLAYGTLSLREVLSQLEHSLKHHPDRHWCRNLSAFRSRLAWHCYFIQKLESQPDAGLVNLNRKYDALVRPWDQERFTAWRLGRTGWPLVDACMRYLIYHGWLNFRMRAMLVSIACYTLKLPWQPVSDYLASLFVDFEPGIHYPQIQMQSGTTGQQVLRIYNPVKQAQDLDPHGVFVRRWLPELAQVSNVWIFEPWRMPPPMRERTASVYYPLPLVDFTLSHRDAKDEITALRSGSLARGALQNNAMHRESNPGSTSAATTGRQSAPRSSPAKVKTQPKSGSAEAQQRQFSLFDEE